MLSIWLKIRFICFYLYLTLELALYILFDVIILIKNSL